MYTHAPRCVTFCVYKCPFLLAHVCTPAVGVHLSICAHTCVYEHYALIMYTCAHIKFWVCPCLLSHARVLAVGVQFVGAHMHASAYTDLKARSHPHVVYKPMLTSLRLCVVQFCGRTITCTCPYTYSCVRDGRWRTFLIAHTCMYAPTLMYAHIIVCASSHLHFLMYVCRPLAYISICAHMCVCTHTHVCTHACTRTHSGTHTCTSLCA